MTILIDTSIGSLESAAANAREAESDGYDGAFSGEVSSDPFLSLALAAAETERIDLGTSIALAFSRSPMALAYTAYDLQRFSRGRFILGLGSQVKAHITRRFSMPWGRPAPQMREFVLAMRAAWKSWSGEEQLDFQGEFYRHTLMPPNFMPPRHEFGMPQVLVAGVGDAMTRVAGEVADGFVCHGFTTERWIRERTVPALAEGRRRAGKSMDGFTVKAAIFVGTGDARQIDSAREQLRSRIAFYASTPSYRDVLDLHGWGEIGEQLLVMSKTGRWAEMGGLVGDDMLEAFAIIAPVDELPALVAARCGGVVNRVSLITDDMPPGLLEGLQQLRSSG